MFKHIKNSHIFLLFSTENLFSTTFLCTNTKKCTQYLSANALTLFQVAATCQNAQQCNSNDRKHCWEIKVLNCLFILKPVNMPSVY